MDQAFQGIYFGQKSYEEYKLILEQFSSQSILGQLEGTIKLYLENVITELTKIKVENKQQADEFLKVFNDSKNQLIRAGKELKKTQCFQKEENSNNNFLEYHENMFDKKVKQNEYIEDTLNLIEKKYKLEEANQIIQDAQSFSKDQNSEPFRPPIKTHQDLMTNWLNFSNYVENQQQDEVKNFEKRLESAIANLPEDQKQLPNVPQQWEKNIANMIKKRKTKFK